MRLHLPFPSPEGEGLSPRKGTINRLVALEYLAMNLALVIVPYPSARLREDRLDRQQEPHLLRLEDAALRIDQWDTLALEVETWFQVRRGQNLMRLPKSPNMLERCQAYTGISVAIHH